MEQMTVEQLEEQKRNIEEQITTMRETQKQQAIAQIKDIVVANAITRADLAFIVAPVAEKKPRKVRPDLVA